MRRLLSFLVALIISSPAWATRPADYELEAAARNFRIDTYETYRTNRVEYDRRIAACTEAVKRFYLANDDQGRIQIRKWFEEVKAGNTQSIPDVPQIELAKSLPKSRQQKQTAGADQRKDGFEVTKYESNPRFKSRFNSNHDNTNLVSGDKQKQTGVVRLFSNIGKSILRGRNDENSREDDADPATEQVATTEVIKTDPAAYQDLEDPFAPTSAKAEAGAETEPTAEISDHAGSMEAAGPEAAAAATAADVEADADAAHDAPADSDTQALNKKILNFNLTVEMLNEDLAANTQEPVDALAHTVEQLESADATFTEISEALRQLSSEQRAELTKLASLEDAATEVMTSINERIARQEADPKDVTGEDDPHTKLEDLRKRVSKVLANHAL